MYTPLIGRRLLERANLRDGVDRSPAEFFDEVFHRLVFDADQYLMQAGNSKFGQLVNGRKRDRATALKEGRAWDEPERARLRREALADFHASAAEATEPQMHLVLGGYARGSDGTTSGQVTAIDHRADADEVYLSWIGAATGAGVAGGLVLLIDHDEVLDAVLEGWALYRRLLTGTPDLKPNQLETWNGQWLRHRFSALYNAADPLFFAPNVIDNKKSPSNLTTVPWARLLFALGRSLGDASIPAYVYSTGQMNTTIGFVPLRLGETGALRDSYATLRGFYQSLFGDAADVVGEDQLDAVYDAGRGFWNACTDGAIGLRAFEPSKLRDFLPGGDKDRQPKPTTPATAQTHLLYETWIDAMLGAQRNDLFTLADETAEAFLDFETGAIGGKQNLKTSVKDALKASGVDALIDALTQIASDVQNASKADLASEEIIKILGALDGLVRTTLDLTPERFRLFLALLRFRMAFHRGKAAHGSSSS